MEEDVNIILIGAQGSGKGTQGEKLSLALDMRHIASGDLFREALEKQTGLGLRAKAYLEKGELVPDEITVAMVLERISQRDCLAGFLLDGFPRTIAQAQALEDDLHHIRQRIDIAVYLEVPREELLKRLSGRYICRAHQHVYNVITHPPKVPGICDLDGSELYLRVDDRGEAIQKRLDIFFSETIHLLNYYRKQQKLATVNGNQEIEQVYRDLLSTLKGAQGKKQGILPWQIPLSSNNLPSLDK
jgi:adenylate kinase